MKRSTLMGEDESVSFVIESGVASKVCPKMHLDRHFQESLRGHILLALEALANIF